MRNYLRVRGEYVYGAVVVAEGLELPPRARRILLNGLREGFAKGTTSACAENTATYSARLRTTRNYLRVRGEYPASTTRSPFTRELPPRARRILPGLAPNILNMGTTSACAENTSKPHAAESLARNYLRVRGEYAMDKARLVEKMELPPRARRIP